MQVSLGRRWAPHRGIQLNPPPQVKLGCGRAESHQQNPRFKTHDLKILKDTYKPGGVTPLPPPTPRIPLGFRALEVPGGSLGGVSLRLVGPWGLQEPGGQVFFGARGSPWSGQGMYHCKIKL